ncbi:PDZ domain-containing protein [Ornithinibacillus sp. L9]|uniref:PDZ domain-containing protein n=1 Tax=Ornithinibacillus caprae TaxID=2678566 RepID=A0A6N8FL54_9BACI|nr:PDZ domain-containing protein [Ornithinibacillus caprae]MUK89084.1 PDZ domain-containing protein [Ornithinibacillus caprae]
MLEAWLMELLKAVGRLFLNPLLYWTIILVTVVGYRRVKRDRVKFGAKVFDVFAEWKDTWILSITLGLFISILTIGIGFLFTYETILLLSVITILLSFTLRFSMLSASYTIGLTYILLLLIPLLLENQKFINVALFSSVSLTALTILLGLFLMVEAQLLSKTKRNETFPDLSLDQRGGWVGIHHVKKLSIIPFFTLIPHGLIESFAPYWPYFTIGEETYSLVLVPFVIGFHHVVKGGLPDQATIKIAKSVFFLALIVTAIAVGSIFVSWLSIAAVVIAILGREIINYRHRINDQRNRPFFHQTNDGLKVLSIIPGSPADRLQILVGETITKVNGKRITTEQQFYEALQETGAFFKLDLIDDFGEVRFVQSAIYEGDHHELGLIFTSKPHRLHK